ncbi:starvation-inducible outer membrane lipoprotein [Roseovarius sp. MBR-79]|jgi:starvation-inducible outer membrane lipoprotein
MTFINMLRRPARIAALCASIGLIVSGCVAVPTETELRATKDECSQFRQPFVNIARQRNERIEKWAKIGAAAGVAIGASIARSNNKNVMGGAVGRVSNLVEILRRRSPGGLIWA